MGDYTKDLKKFLRENGCIVDNAIKSRHTANTVLKQAGLPKKF